MYKPLNSKIELDVIDPKGAKLDTLQLRNAPLSELYPEEKAVIIQWTDTDNQRPELEELVSPVEYVGQTYHGNWAWGSAVKRGQTIGLTNDFPRTDGPVTLVEDGQRVARWLLAQGTFGGFFADEITIGILPPGTQLDCGLVEDGFGYIKRSLFEQFVTEQRVKLGNSRDNWTFWQRLPWESIKEEALDLITGHIGDAANPEKMLWMAPQSFDYKKQLVSKDRAMIEHPYVAASLTRSSQEYFARLATSIYLEGQYRVAVPTSCEKVCWPGKAGKVSIDRSPIDSNGSIQALEIELSDCYGQESTRIANLEVIQVSISAKDFASKGCLGVADDLPFDLVICSEDIKMGPKGAKGQLTIQNVCIPFIQVWGKGSAAGVSASWAHNLMGLDHDGDGVRLADLNELPLIWQAIKDLPIGETPKLVKTKRKIETNDLRAEMVLKSMTNLVGFATNVAGTTFAVDDRDLVAHELGLKSVAALDARLNFFIKVGTDGFKTDVDQQAVAKEIAVMQTSLGRLFGSSAPWMSWDSHAWAFRRGLPPIIVEEVDHNQHIFRCQKSEGVVELRLSDTELENAIWPWMDGTIPQIARTVIPAIEGFWTESVAIRPLTEFRSWAREVTDELLEQAKEVQFWFNARVVRVNFSDPKDIGQFHVDFKERLKEWTADPELAASALWRVAHSSRGQDASAASVFTGFPEEALKIVAGKPGKNTARTVITGLSYQLPGFENGALRVEVADITTFKSGKKIIRKALLGDVPGQIMSTNLDWPENLLAFVAANADQPPVGEYMARISKNSANSWLVALAQLV